MKKTLVCSTSTSCLDYYPYEHDIELMRLKIQVYDEFLADGSEIKADDFYEILKNDKNFIPKTSQPSIEEVTLFYEDIIKRGYERVFISTISSKLSGTYNVLATTAKTFEDKLEIIVFDTKTVFFNEALFALRASQMFKDGLSSDEVVKKLEILRDNNTIFFVVEKLDYLIKNGRLSGAKAFFGKLLKVKPVLQLQKTGEITSIDSSKSTKKALHIITNKIKEYTKGKNYEAYLLMTGDGELKDFFSKIISDELGLDNLILCPGSPVVGGHVGPNCVGISIILKD